MAKFYNIVCFVLVPRVCMYAFHQCISVWTELLWKSLKNVPKIAQHWAPLWILNIDIFFNSTFAKRLKNRARLKLLELLYKMAIHISQNQVTLFAIWSFPLFPFWKVGLSSTQDPLWVHHLKSLFRLGTLTWLRRSYLSCSSDSVSYRAELWHSQVLRPVLKNDSVPELVKPDLS
jgi:hypothetical protein